jgi:hypothetical protein
MWWQSWNIDVVEKGREKGNASHQLCSSLPLLERNSTFVYQSKRNGHGPRSRSFCSASGDKRSTEGITVHPPPTRGGAKMAQCWECCLAGRLVLVSAVLPEDSSWWVDSNDRFYACQAWLCIHKDGFNMHTAREIWKKKRKKLYIVPCIIPIPSHHNL